ncbi:hypothetical protein J3S90_15505 [Flavobacterium sp. P4023]|uniref:Abi-like protein n=1 Tax=Flavobacterium flabelliforme TaxID=2816119 RepID=A0ABS5CX45_9FLAO|nr:hypothetical protein [Flavobacterium flabelliforme]MBP4143211.1 hypothetical protein [Flavobacterium flabelliforme]
MITKERFREIDTEIKSSITKCLHNFRNSFPESYILFLADAEYKKEYDYDGTKLNPYIIDNRIDKFKDETRLKFLVTFLNQYYRFENGKINVDDNEERINLELMIYSHIWESKPFLKKLHRLAHLCNGENYDWNVIVDDMGKHNFIRNDIRANFQKSNIEIAEIIKKGFHTSLRNAFAHSEYSFDTMNNHNRINLYNYKNENWELKLISFNDWSERFAYSAVFSYHFLDLIYKARIEIENDFKQNVFTINHPSRNNGIKRMNIKYNAENNWFTFQK